MRGGSRYKKHLLEPDRNYRSVLVAKFINYVMLEGKKETAQTIVYAALERLEHDTKKPAAEIFESAIRTVSPLIEVRSRRIGGANYQVPMEVRPDRQIALAMRWVIDASRSRKGKTMADRLADELRDILQGTGVAMKKREDLHKMAEANRAFAHFARF
ncbi:30S ribosomal protein S7 [Candidatus Berkelbacteria bacterium]|nr:30S ribosomal protein S7 [Candidatus Berkelbacteria bacterium]